MFVDNIGGGGIAGELDIGGIVIMGVVFFMLIEIVFEEAGLDGGGALNQSSTADEGGAGENDLSADTGVCGLDGISGVPNQSGIMGVLLAAGAAILVF